MIYLLMVFGDVQVDTRTTERFRKYAEASKRLNLYEVALPFLMVFEHSQKRQGWEARVQGLIQDAKHLEPKEQQTISRLIARNSDPQEVAKKPTGQVLRFCEKFLAFTQEFQTELTFLPNNATDGDEE